MNDDHDFGDDVGAFSYCRPEEIDRHDLRNALSGLQVFDDDLYLRMQAFNLGIIDQFIMEIEYKVLKRIFEDERTPSEAYFLSAQSQMWIFAAYELMRTWRQRAKDILKWSDNGGLETKLKVYETDIGYQHIGRDIRAAQIKRVLDDNSIVDKIRDDIRLTHILFSRTEAIRVAIAKHEVGGRKGSVALMPGYGRINKWCGSLDYDLGNGVVGLMYINRRDIADGIRALSDGGPLPSDETIKDFDTAMRGPSDKTMKDIDAAMRNPSKVPC